VREDYSADGTCWEYFPHDHARSRAYRWGEDGLLGWTDRECRLCFAVALWNEKDPILKERLFGLTNSEGNHGEDCKELYYYLDSSPSHSYCQALYKYPQSEYPYARLLAENRARSQNDPEFELLDTGIFDQNRYFDVFAEYAKASPDDTLIRLTLANRGPDPATLHVLPTVWFRNTWIWGCQYEGCTLKPRLAAAGAHLISAEHQDLEPFLFAAEPAQGQPDPQWLFTENETNMRRLYGSDHYTPYVKDAFHNRVIHGQIDAVNPGNVGTKAAAWYKLTIPAGGQIVLRLRLASEKEAPAQLFDANFDQVFTTRKNEMREYYTALRKPLGEVGVQHMQILRQGVAGLLWSKQFYHYSVRDWLAGDPSEPPPPASRLKGRNHHWTHLFNRDVISMPDTWEYPWYAAWDLAFHMIPFARLDPQFAKEQLLLLLREWYLNPNGQIPAYEFAFGDVNPPVHAWACWRVYKMTAARGERDLGFLAQTFHKLLINFTWWVNRKDPKGHNVFSGGFLGMDNIGAFDRNQTLPGGGHLQQADGTAWMAFYCGTMLSMALELAGEDPSYEGVASKFFEHYVTIADAMNTLGGSGLWDPDDGFYYDQIFLKDTTVRMRTRSMVGLIPLIAVEVLDDKIIRRLPDFRKRLQWFLSHRADLRENISCMENDGDHPDKMLLAIPSRSRLTRVLQYIFNESEFLSPYGLRSVSKIHEQHPSRVVLDGHEYSVNYIPGESTTGMFGGNSNWRGPIWFPVNYLLMEALQRYGFFYGDTFTIEYPTGSGRRITLGQAADKLGRRLVRLFLPDANGNRPCHGGDPRYANDPHFKDLVLFYEYFHGDTGRGCGASHQTGWTGLVIKIINDLGRRGRL
ncbi:MAG: glucosidase, partial [Opitutales bacterium]